VLGLALLGFGLESIVRAVIPLMVLERGGDAVWIGLVTAAAALPSVLFRPYVGRLIDTWSHQNLLRIGTAATAFGAALLLLPGLATLAVMRLVHGTGWATYSVANHALMAKLAPADRRGEASGWFMAMPAAAMLVTPAAGVALFVSAGQAAPIAAALALGAVAVVLAFGIRVPRAPSVHPATGAGAAPDRNHMLERTALPSTVMITAFMAGHSLFFAFPAVYLEFAGESTALLPAYYLVYGIVMTVSQLLVGGVSDRVGRAWTIRVGCAVAIAGLAAALVLTGIPALVVASAAYAIAMSLVSPTLSALTIDLAPPGRLGAAMATYSLGYQLGAGSSGIVWGIVISTFGFPWPFALAIVFQLVTLGLTIGRVGGMRARTMRPVGDEPGGRG
jgi:MFS family permease